MAVECDRGLLCAGCLREGDRRAARSRAAGNREVERARCRAYKAANRRKVSDYNQKRYYGPLETRTLKTPKARPPRAKRGFHDPYKQYGITASDYFDMLKAQDNKCASCGDSETARKNDVLIPLAIDHCHSTGKVRGLLCLGCNTGLGNFKDSTERMLRGIQYLRASK